MSEQVFQQANHHCGPFAHGCPVEITGVKRLQRPLSVR